MVEAFDTNYIVGVREEPRLTEQQFGNFQNLATIVNSKAERARFGRFYYRCVQYVPAIIKTYVIERMARNVGAVAVSSACASCGVVCKREALHLVFVASLSRVVLSFQVGGKLLHRVHAKGFVVCAACFFFPQYACERHAMKRASMPRHSNWRLSRPRLAVIPM